VVFVETPKYYSGYLKRVFPEMDTESWARRTTVNGGKEFGLVVDKVEDLPAAIETVIANPAEYPKQRERLQSFLLYNRGRAAEVAVATVEDLLARKVKTKRPCRQHGVLRTIVQTAAQRICGSVRRRVKKFALRIFQQRGYTLVKAGQGYIAAQEVVAAARSRGLSVCEYRESLEDNPRKVGRRDRIVKRLKEAGVFQNITTVCEIGTGTGMYLEKILLSASPSRYEVYETDVGWVDFIKAEYGAHSTCRVVCHPCDGRSLSDTGDGSVDLVHAHGVFVYLPLLQSLAYLRECIRVSRPGGFIVFDCYLDSTFSSMKQVEPWLAGSHHWPVVIPKVLLDDLASRYHMRVVDQFDEIHASGTCNYLIWKNMEESAASATT
jgi:SAM-dependent methyltransferase